MVDIFLRVGLFSHVMNIERLMVHFSILTFGKVALVYETGNHMAVLQIIVVMGTKNVGRNDTGKHTAMLLMIRPAGGDIQKIYEPHIFWC